MSLGEWNNLGLSAHIMLIDLLLFFFFHFIDNLEKQIWIFYLPSPECNCIVSRSFTLYPGITIWNRRWNTVSLSLSMRCEVLFTFFFLLCCLAWREQHPLYSFPQMRHRGRKNTTQHKSCTFNHSPIVPFPLLSLGFLHLKSTFFVGCSGAEHFAFWSFVLPLSCRGPCQT